jgi:hypothetical protein
MSAVPQGLPVLSDEEFLWMVEPLGQPAELNDALLQLRREGRIQIYDDGSGDPYIVLIEKTT